MAEPDRRKPAGLMSTHLAEEDGRGPEELCPGVKAPPVTH